MSFTSKALLILARHSLADIAVSDFYVGIFAKRYCYVPPARKNPDGRSITELEYHYIEVERTTPAMLPFSF
jgi:hypothetical protein